MKVNTLLLHHIHAPKMKVSSCCRYKESYIKYTEGAVAQQMFFNKQTVNKQYTSTVPRGTKKVTIFQITHTVGILNYL